MVLVSFANQKGGSGKSTLTTAVATMLAVDYNYRVLVIDADTQQSIAGKRKALDTQLLNEGEEFPYPILGLAPGKILDYLDSLEEGQYDVVLIDLPGRSDDVAGVEVIISCDLVIVPVVASDFDQLSTGAFLDGMSAVIKEGNPDLKLRVLRMKVNPGQLEEEAAVEFLESYGIAQMPLFIQERAGYKRVSTLRPVTSRQYAREMNITPQVQQEVVKLTEAVVEILGLPSSTATE
ncbi:ParA family protein [Hymenobacter endophyticus]|uniref:ParA family protein n=1 Tax=Hymenobacter endophyticus TaxID=3076335 RepID=A0ABU3TKV5_9BACT|nr:ParA family protein [Hymenobacter endophyticus]MDU0372006.1 ParA family protein [Hymenobacter endophyticus]